MTWLQQVEGHKLWQVGGVEIVESVEGLLDDFDDILYV
jgi:hypothetical protein